jgi:hypothetical protein
MSRSNPDGERLINPAFKFLEFNGAEGCFEYFDKEAINNDPKSKTGKGLKIKVPLPFNFIVLEDGLATITGYSDRLQNGFYSNEVRTLNLKTEKFYVRCGKEKIAEGTYEQIKGKEAGMKYTASIYMAFNSPVFKDGIRVTRDDVKDGKPVKVGVSELVIGHIKMTGAGLNGWIDFKKEAGSSINTGALSVKSCSDETKGAVKYKKPIFTVSPISEETNQKAIALDVQLQEYLKKYFEVGSPLSKITPEEEAKIAKEAIETIEQHEVQTEKKVDSFLAEMNAEVPLSLDEPPF